ncbi:TIGR03757 family integrating conjugative element protein [Chelonobacter oris]|uniref:TIGR03757 family integrating conjugative element protein n=1 Tax=Chelonobacter oris TaxID=505317 RepID=UPI00244C3563|nr:TIGR03757 family integrating conjugative element protein [Chelonobacter oris]
MPKITIYTTKAYQVELQSNDNATRYYLDHALQLEDQFTRHFSDNPDEAEKQAHALFNSPDWQQQEAQLKQAYEGVISGWQNGIKKVPAILFQADGVPDSVIYGVTELTQAKQYWLTWLQQHIDNP